MSLNYLGPIRCTPKRRPVSLRWSWEPKIRPFGDIEMSKTFNLGSRLPVRHYYHYKEKDSKRNFPSLVYQVNSVSPIIFQIIYDTIETITKSSRKFTFFGKGCPSKPFDLWEQLSTLRFSLLYLFSPRPLLNLYLSFVSLKWRVYTVLFTFMYRQWIILDENLSLLASMILTTPIFRH